MTKPLCPFCGILEPEAYSCPPDVLERLEPLSPPELEEHFHWGQATHEHSNYPDPGTRPELVQVNAACYLLMCPPCARKYGAELSIHPWLLVIAGDRARQELLADQREGANV